MSTGTVIRTTIQLRRGKASEWASVNPVLKVAEPGFEIDTFKLKIGDGTTAFNDLPYVGNATLTIEGDNQSIIVENGVAKLVGFDAATDGQTVRKKGTLLEWFTPATSEDVTTVVETVKTLESTVTNQGTLISNLETSVSTHASEIKNLQQIVNSKIDGVKLGGTLLDIVEGKVEIPIATFDLLGVVKSSEGTNSVSVKEDGTMEVNSIGLSKLEQDIELVLNGGSLD